MRFGSRDVAIGIMSSGMGCPSLDIIVTELLNLAIWIYSGARILDFNKSYTLAALAF